MTIKLKTINERLVWLLTIGLLSSFYIFETYSWGKYLFLLITLIIVLLTVLDNKGKYKVEVDAFFYYGASLIAYTFCSALWAINAEDAIQKGITLSEIFVCTFLVMNYYKKYDSVSILLAIIKWTSFVIVIYSMLFYGINYIGQMVLSGSRIDNSYTNINSIGMIAALGVVLQIDELFRNRVFRLSALLCVMSVYMIAATQSRKALVLLVLGSLLVVVVRSSSNKRLINKVIKAVIVIIAFILLVRYAMTLKIFSGVMERMGWLIALITGNGYTGSSATIRSELIRIGIDNFLKHPLFGIGIGCPHILAARIMNYDAYLHNNYVELLAGGGLIGLIIYYSIYVFLFHTIKKYSGTGNSEKTTITILLLMLLVMDVGMVSVYSKSTYFYFMTCVLEAGILKKESGNANVFK